LIFWGDFSTTYISRAENDGSDVNTTFIPASPCGIAVDTLHVYWTNNSGAIGRANLDGTGRDDNFLPLDAGANCGVAVNANYIYWTRQHGLGRANLDGSGMNTQFIADAGGGTTNGVAVDANYVYWGDVDQNKVGRADLAGTNPNASFISTTNGVRGVAVDAAHVYWANYWAGGGGGTTIGRADLAGTNPSNTFISGATYPCGVAVDSAHVYWGNDNAVADGVGVGRANLDGSSPNQNFIDTPAACGVGVNSLFGSTTTVTATPPDPTTYGEPLTFNAAVTGKGATPTGSVGFIVTGEDPVGVGLDGQGNAMFDPGYYLNVGDSVEARYGGDGTGGGGGTYVPSSGSLTPDIQPAGTSLEMTLTPSPTTVGTPVQLVATVTNTDTSITPFGSISVSIDGQLLGSEPVDADGTLSGSLTPNVAGDFTIDVDYADDTGTPADFQESHASTVIHVAPRVTSTVTGVSPAPPSATPPPPVTLAPPPTSAPARTCKVPRLIGLKLAAAKRKLTAAGCRLGHVAHKKGRHSRRGRVLKQTPKPGASVPLGTKVGLTVGR
jgi:hypothetical protein